MASLKVTSGQLAGTTVEIADELVIGRVDAGLTLDDTEVSRRHAIIRHVGGALQVEDLGSSNGTFVDGVRIEGPTLLGSGTKLKVGTTELVVEGGLAGATRISRRPDPHATRLSDAPPLDPQLTRARAASPPPASPAHEPATAPPGEPATAPPGESEPPGRPRLGRPGPPGRPGRGRPGPPGGPGRGRPGFRPPIPLLAALAAVVAVALIVYFATSSSKKAKPASTSAGASLIDVPVQFSVRDMNRTQLHCPATGRTYEVAGRLVVPASAASAVTLYLSGVIFSGMFEFHNDLVPGYDYAREMAKLGQASVVIDRVGYGATVPYPSSGISYCVGSQADMVHQIIGDLRTGGYSVRGSSGVHPRTFARVALAGYSIGGVISELEAASFADVNGLMLISWADQGFSTFGTSIPYVLAHCKPGSPKPPGGAAGYFRTLPPEKVPPLVSRQADPKIVATFAGHEELDPCGQELAGQQWFAGLDNAARARIEIPVLIIYGDYDVLFNANAWKQQYVHFTGTTDRTLTGIPDGQMLMLDRHVPLTRRVTSSWLATHRL